MLFRSPYPMLIADPDAAHPDGHGYILSGGGKRGVRAEGAALDGQRVRIDGALVKRGSFDLLLVGSMKPEPGAALAPKRENLGTWRVVGEICDGKCVAGVMRPGEGLAHKACASVCVLGGVPPVLVVAGPVAGHEFLDRKSTRLNSSH